MELWKICNGNDYLIVAISVSNLKPYVCGNLDNCIVSLHVQEHCALYPDTCGAHVMPQVGLTCM